VLVPIDRQTAAYNGLGDTAGVFVQNLSGRSPAFQAGLRRNDLIVGANGQKIADGEELTRLIIQAKIGSTVKFDVLRGGRRVSLDIPIVARQ
jgi:S1-C subfamily serine protease